MRSVKSFLAAGAATLISSMAFAADMPIAAPPMYAPPPPADLAAGICAAISDSAISGSDRLNNVLDANNLTSNQRLGF